MPSLRCALSLPLVLIASIASAQQPSKTDAEMDGFAGQIKSVSTTETHFPVKWRQPDGSTLAIPIFCRECDYDSEGTNIRSGQVVSGEFHGEISVLERDGNGHVIDRKVYSASTGQLLRHEILGPFGKTHETDYLDGKVSSEELVDYDQYGHMSNWQSLDSAGNQTSRNRTITTKDGVPTDRSGWGKDDRLSWRQTYDPKTEEEHFTTYDDSGSVKLILTCIRGQVTSFREQSDLPSEFGGNLIASLDNGNAENYDCAKNRSCERSIVHYEYMSPGKRNPTSAEWRDAEGRLLYAAYYEYELDAFQNWTHRKVSVWSYDNPERTPYEDDTRTITYWQE